jgi:catechol 2,3-dioxygenase-like lactoylglutathione lyase family enzyme
MANLTHVFPSFIISDLKTSVPFYVDKLGFEIRFIGPDDDPFFAIVGRDNVSIMLKAVADDIKPIPNRTRHKWAPWDAFIHTADPDALFHEYRSAGLEFYQSLQVDGDNIRGFAIADADGYVLFFGRPWP